MAHGFFINRLLRMSAAEILYRVGQKARNISEMTLPGILRFDTEPLEQPYRLFSGQISVGDCNSLQCRRVIEKADKLCANRFDIFALKDYQIEGDIDYHRDYKSGRSAPADTFGKSINYRDSGRIGDIKYIWEPNRHLFLVPLAMAYNQTKQPQYMEKFEQLLSGWMDQNPFMKGVNWASSLELGIRLINWTICWHLVGEDVRPELKKRWLESVYLHCWFIDRNMSKFSSANNHLIGEAAGLFIGSVAMPRFKDSLRWRKKAHRILIRECGKQNYPDGVNKEQATSYQQFVLDFLTLSGLAGQANGVDFPTEYWGIVEKMLTCLAAMEDAGGNLPGFGDDDDGYVVDKDLKTQLLLDMADIQQAKKQQANIKPINIQPGYIQPEYIQSVSGKLPDAFEDGGYYILGTDFGTSEEQKLVFDCGSLGYLSLAAHGHADALSFTFSAGGSPIWIDPGTYAYHADKRWRNYFRSTAAHNTVRVDGRDQSLMSGNFMWSSKAEAQMVEHRSLTMIKGMHSGYKDMSDSVLHTRTVKFIKDENDTLTAQNAKEADTHANKAGKYAKEAGTWEIEDHLQCEGSHQVEIFFHLHPDCRIESAEDGHSYAGNRADTLVVHFDKGVCRFEKDDTMELRIFQGDEALPLGWYSPSYDVKVPSATLRLSKKIEGSVKIKTRFTIVFSK